MKKTINLLFLFLLLVFTMTSCMVLGGLLSNEEPEAFASLPKKKTFKFAVTVGNNEYTNEPQDTFEYTYIKNGYRMTGETHSLDKYIDSINDELDRLYDAYYAYIEEYGPESRHYNGEHYEYVVGLITTINNEVDELNEDLDTYRADREVRDKEWETFNSLKTSNGYAVYSFYHDSSFYYGTSFYSIQSPSINGSVSVDKADAASKMNAVYNEGKPKYDAYLTEYGPGSPGYNKKNYETVKNWSDNFEKTYKEFTEEQSRYDDKQKKNGEIKGSIQEAFNKLNNAFTKKEYDKINDLYKAFNSLYSQYTNDDLKQLNTDAKAILKKTNIYFWTISEKHDNLLNSITSSWLDKQVYLLSEKYGKTLRGLIDSSDFSNSVISATMYYNNTMKLEIYRYGVDYSFMFELKGDNVVMTSCTSKVGQVYYSTDIFEMIILMGYAFE